MSLTAAAARLHGLVKGALVGVRVLKHGVSPRVITAEVVGTGGNTVVSGLSLQKRFDLRTNWEVFTALSASPGAAPGGNGGTAADEAAQAALAAGRDAFGVGAQTGAVRALVPLVDAMLVQAIPGLHGQVVPAPAGGGSVSVELLDRGRWNTVASVGLLAGGRYDLALPGRGIYRVSYRGLTTPPVTVG
jgi:stage II sporulation protein D